MLKRGKKRKAASTSRSPKMSREPHPHPTHHRSVSMVSEPSSGMVMTQTMNTEQFSPTYVSSPEMAMHSQHTPHMVVHAPHHQNSTDVVNVDNIWRGFEMTSNEQLPVWLSDQSLGGSSFSQNGMDAFLLPNDYLPPAPQIW